MSKFFYEDYTHRTPFTIESINYIQQVSGFKNINFYNFRQLPIIWNFSFLVFFSELTRIFLPDSLGKNLNG